MAETRRVTLGVLISMLLFGFLVSECSNSQKEAELLSSMGNFCNKVNNKNWYTAAWSPKSAQKICETKAKREMRNFILEGNLRPCSFGGIPMFCRTLPNGNLILYQSDRDPLEIMATDLERISPHLSIY